MIRRSSNQFMYNYQRSLNRANNKQAKLLEQGDGSSIHRPSDNSINYAKYLRYNFSNNENTQYQANVALASGWMKTSDDALVGMTDIMQTFKFKTVAASNASQTPTDNKAIAAEMMALIQQVVSLGNNMQGDHYTFAGQADTTRPFELSEEYYDRGLAKTLDTKQAEFFNTAEKYSELTQMLTLEDDDGSTYYLDTTNGYLYSKKFVDEGYKDVLITGRKNVDPTQDAIAKLGGDFFNSGTSTFTDATQETNFKISDFFDSYGVVKNTVDQTGSAAVATTGQAFQDASGNVVDIADNTNLTMTASTTPVTLTAEAGSIFVYNAEDTITATSLPLHFGTSDGTRMTLNDSVEVQLENGNTYTIGTLKTAIADGTVTLRDNSWLEIKNDTTLNFTVDAPVTVTNNGQSFTMNGNTVSIPAGATFSDGTNTYTLTDQTKTLNAIDSDGNTLNLKLTTVHQQMVSYSGDNNYISMVKLNGKADQTSDTVNLTGADIFGTDLFDGANSGNTPSGAAMLNQMLTVHYMTYNDRQAWMSADGVELGDQIHETTNRAETSLGARQQLYEAVSDMLITQNETIAKNLVDVSGTDVAKLATDLMEQSSIMSLALAMGGRILPMSLADYI